MTKYEYSTIEAFRVRKLLDIIHDELSGYLEDEEEAASILHTAFEMLDLWEINHNINNSLCGEIAQKELELFEFSTKDFVN